MGEGLGDYEDLLKGFKPVVNVITSLALQTRSSTRIFRLCLGPLPSLYVKEIFI
jgi:hypothetical protein